LHPLGELPVERPEPEPTPGEEPVNPPDQHPDEPGETTPDENTIKPDEGTGSALGPAPVGKLLPASRTDHPARRSSQAWDLRRGRHCPSVSPVTVIFQPGRPFQ